MIRRHFRLKAKVALLLAVGIPGPYFLLQYFPILQATPAPSIFLDGKIPFIPETMWIYQTLYPCLLLVGFSLFRRHDVIRYSWTLLLASVIADFVFLIHPTFVPRPDFAQGLYGIWTQMERPMNAIPSLHAAFIAISWNYAGAKSRSSMRPAQMLFSVWMIVILISTIATSQHRWLDLAVGLLLGQFCSLLIRRPHPARSVLIVTGSLLEPSGSIAGALLRMLAQRSSEKHGMFSLKIKAVIGEIFVYGILERLGRQRYAAYISEYFKGPPSPPDLTHSLLETMLRKEGIPTDHITVAQVFANPFRTARLLRKHSCIFLSSTLLHDQSELTTVASALKRPWNRVVVGGALTGSLPTTFGAAHIDMLAPGYGEILVPALAPWIQSGFRNHAFESLRVRRIQSMIRVEAFPPSSRDLDFLPSPDFHGQPETIYYESVRGCPYRCSFCNYPYLFSDANFRFKSARKIYDDWMQYAGSGVRTIISLDSLFTIPRKRLDQLCNSLIRAGSPVRWICYVRADDIDLERAQMMREAGAFQVHIGIESGDDAILANMNKKTSAEVNARAIHNLRRAGITSIATLIVGFPGETEQSIQTTLNFLQQNPPDFHFLAAFSTRVPGVPVLSEESKSRFGLVVNTELATMSPYWSHATMDCAKAGVFLRNATKYLIENRISLDAALFHKGLSGYDPAHRAELLDFQEAAIRRYTTLRRFMDAVHQKIDHALARDMAAFFQ